MPSIFSSHRARFFLAWRQVVWQVEENSQEPAGSRDDRWTNAQKIITPLFFISKDKDRAGNQFTQHIKLKVTTSKVTWPKTTPFKYTKHFFHYTNSKLVVGRCWSIKKTHPHLPPLYNLCKWGDALFSLLSFKQPRCSTCPNSMFRHDQHGKDKANPWHHNEDCWLLQKDIF